MIDSLTPLTTPLDCYQGDDYSQTINWTDAGGTAIDFTGFSATLQARSGVGSGSTLIVEISTSNSRMTLNSSGAMTLTLAHADSASLSPGNYPYWLRVTDSGGKEQVWMLGTFTVYEVGIA